MPQHKYLVHKVGIYWYVCEVIPGDWHGDMANFTTWEMAMAKALELIKEKDRES